ncbi:MAG: UDP-N-acetylmuramoyl-L-alanine--D-glutamate ligase [bacterium]|nr:UDP-N-acetylmuramoyl-L-alanine--D-glutamate ligase [bacterium]
MLTIKNLQNKKIAMLGLGIENLALVEWLIKHKVKCEITICDRRDKEQLGDAYRRLLCRLPAPRNDKLGKGYDKGLDKFDVLFRSPGWPLAEFSNKITSPMRLFFDLCPTKNIIGVTGTKGKGTTASLIYEILRAAGKRVWLGGNIGVAPFVFLDKIKPTDWVVLELSSFQLEDMTVSPRIAVITNFYSEHLAPADPNNPNYHKSLREYRKAKNNIFKWQKSGAYLIINNQYTITKQIPNPKSQIKYFKKSDLPSKLIGEHNKENIAAAVAAAKLAGVKNEIIKKAVAGFKGLEYRLEFVKKIKGVKYYDDSFATTPESTITALKSFSAPIIVLLGGADKGADFKELAAEATRRCKFVVLLNGGATPRVKRELLAAGYKNNKMKLADNIKDAVASARAQAEPGDVILLSTACASFGMFKNYKQRGDLFKRLSLKK